MNKNDSSQSNKINAVIASGQVSALAEFFPDAKSLILNNEGEDSILAKIVKFGNAKFLDRTLKKYFTDKNPQDFELKLRFLDGRDKAGKKLNYHYFHDCLSPNITSQTDAAFGVNPQIKIINNDNKRMSDLYKVIKKHKIAAQNELLQGNIDDLDIPDLVLSPDGRPAAIKSDEFGNSKAIKLDYPPIFLLLSPRKDESDHAVYLLFAKSDQMQGEALSKRAYLDLDFPEEFVSLAKSLDNIQKEWDSMYEDEYLAPIADNFIINNGLICLEDRFQNDQNYYGYMHESDKRFYIHVNASKVDENPFNTIPHELGHCADDANSPFASDNKIFKYGLMLSFLNPDVSLERQCVVDNVLDSLYYPENYGNEFMANLVQNSKMNHPSYQKDHLLKNLYKLYGTLSLAENKGYSAVVDRINSMASRMEGEAEFDQVYEAFFDYCGHSFIREQGKIHKNLYYILTSHPQKALNKMLDVMDQTSSFKSGDLVSLEKDFTLNIISELRSISQVMQDEEARVVEVPEEFRSLKTKRPVELVMAQAQKDFDRQKRQNTKHNHRKLLAAYNKLKGNSKGKNLSNAKFNEYFAYCKTYLDLQESSENKGLTQPISKRDKVEDLDKRLAAKFKNGLSRDK